MTKSVTRDIFVLDASTRRFKRRDVTFTPGLYKVFEETLVKAANNKQRNPDMDRFK